MGVRDFFGPFGWGSGSSWPASGPGANPAGTAKCSGSAADLCELSKIGIDVAKSTVEKYMVRSRKPPSPTWRAFLKNHVKDIVAIDFLGVPTVRNQTLFVFLVLAHDCRRVLHFDVTSNPTAAWTAQQIVEALPWELQAKYPLRDQDKIYGDAF